ncbi:MAG TPA: hypothetical protein VGJ92_00720 [Methanocella sp.]
MAEPENRFILAEIAGTGAESAEYYARALLELVFVSAPSAPVPAISARI